MGVSTSRHKSITIMAATKNSQYIQGQLDDLKRTVQTLKTENEILRADKQDLMGEKIRMQNSMEEKLNLIPLLADKLDSIQKELLSSSKVKNTSQPDKDASLSAGKSGSDRLDENNGSDKDDDNDNAKPVMLSLNVKTMKETADNVRRFLKQNRIGTWMCTGMDGGVLFRDEIVKAVENCDVFLAFINDAWAQSGECRYEFEYAQRLSLTKGKPKIVPVLFSDLDWNAYSHVRLLLANTNGILYKEDEVVKAKQTILNAIEAAGVRAQGSYREKAPSSWSTQEVLKFLGEVLLRKVEQESITGKDLVSYSDDQLIRKLKLSDDQIKTIHAEIKGEIVDKFQGSFWIRGCTINNYDSNKTESNIFSITFRNFGLASSGMVWGCGTKHSNYNKVTCVWQGSYTEDGEVEFEARYSNNTHETYKGTVDGDKLDLKYLWYGYGRKSSGRAEFTLKKKPEADVNQLTKETW